MAIDTAPQGRATRDLAFYERLISRGIAEADARGSAIDHITARRLAIWLLPRSQQEPEFMRGLIHFARTGGITGPLKKHLQHHARSSSHPSRPHAARLLQYAVARGKDSGRIGDNFGAICDQIDHADALLEDLHERVVESRIHPELAAGDWRERFTLKPVVMARRDAVTRAVTFIVDGAVAKAAVRAITLDAMEREARIRQVRQQGETLSEGSEGKKNRKVIVARETQIAAGLRAIERVHHAALEPTPAPEFSQILPVAGSTPDHEPELE
jgi:hypothetical protein